MADEPSPSLPDNPPTPDPAPDPEPSFTPVTSQDQFDAMVKARINREREKYADYEDLKTKAAKLAELEAANLTELEKSQKRTADLERKAADAEARAQENLLRASVVAEAARKNVVDPDAVVALLDRSVLEFNEDGTPTNTAEAVDELLKAKPYLVGTVGGARGNADQGARQFSGNQLGDDALKSMSPEQIDKAHREGRFSELLGANRSR